MSEISLETPWVSESLAAPPHRSMTGVNVLPGYASFTTMQVGSTLSSPWSRHTLPVHQPTAIQSLDELTL